MVDPIEHIRPFTPGPITAADLEHRVVGGQRPAQNRGAPPGSFPEVLASEIDGALRFSSHAQERLRARAIQLSDRDQLELTRAVDMAGRKGARESLILIDDLALIVSIQNRVVITAMERGVAQPNVFTHIDSAVILPQERP